MYASASIFAFPSFTETFGQVVLEALASGLPVVGLHAEGTSDLVSHGRTGLLLDVNAVAKESTVAANDSRAATPGARGISKLDRSASASALAISEFAHAASSAALQLRSPSSPTKPSTTAETTTVGLASRIPSTLEFKASMTPNTVWFHQCARAYSMLLERLIVDRETRALMGQRAVLNASRKTWWDAMDAPVRGYERVIASTGTQNLSDDQLEAWRTSQRRHAPLTGPRVKLAVVLYIALFAWLVWLRFVSSSP